MHGSLCDSQGLQICLQCSAARAPWPSALSAFSARLTLSREFCCRYLEKVVPSPYGPRLPWYFPLSRSFWLSGDVTEGPVVLPRLKRLFTATLCKLRSPQHQPYEQVHNSLLYEFETAAEAKIHRGVSLALLVM